MGWLRSARFDLSLVVGALILGLLAGIAVTWRPGWLPGLLVLDFWLLGYPHVVATYTRLVFDRESLAEHRGLVTWLPVVVASLVAAVAFSAGVWLLISIYFYWQAWHYARQSYGISRIYRRRERTVAPALDPLRPELDDTLDAAVIFGVPLAGVLYRSSQGWTSFLGLDVRMAPVPVWVVAAAAVGAGAAVLAWSARQAWLATRRRLELPHALYIGTHIVQFVVGYCLIEDLTRGWLVLNVWHNAQYLGIVWMFNANRFRQGETRAAPLLSAISQPAALGRYVFVIYALATMLFALIVGLPGVKIAAISGVLLLSQALNFHHYIVDAIIWKVRKPQVGGLLAGGLRALAPEVDRALELERG